MLLCSSPRYLCVHVPFLICISQFWLLPKSSTALSFACAMHLPHTIDTFLILIRFIRMFGERISNDVAVRYHWCCGKLPRCCHLHHRCRHLDSNSSAMVLQRECLKHHAIQCKRERIRYLAFSYLDGI